MMGCDHCLHPLWCGIRCGICGRWADEKDQPSEALKQAWDTYQKALKKYGPTDDTHTCHDQCQRPACVQTRKAVEAERERILAILDDMQAMAGNLHNYYGFAANKIREKSNGVL